MTFPRHHMVRVAREAWPAILVSNPQAAALPLVRNWVDRGWPLVVRRPVCADGLGRLPVGLPLPPSMGKLRLSFVVSPDAILFDQAPPLLSDVAPAAPASWHAAIAELVEGDPATRCYGSLAWHVLTGLDYLSPTSDLDLLWAAGDAADATSKTRMVAAIDMRSPMGIDGELVTPAGHAVQWREWSSAAPELLVKTLSGGEIMTRDRVFG